MLGVPESGEEFDYGFKLKDIKVSSVVLHYTKCVKLNIILE